MQIFGTIVIVEDDVDDRAFLEKVLKELGVENKITWFDSTNEAMEFLLKTSQKIFIIFSDINLPGDNGLEFKQQIDDDPYLRKKSIPFVFYSTSANQRDIDKAYSEMTIQGFFKKPDDYGETKRLMQVIFDYWSICKHPNT